MPSALVQISHLPSGHSVSPTTSLNEILFLTAESCPRLFVVLLRHCPKATRFCYCCYTGLRSPEVGIVPTSISSGVDAIVWRSAANIPFSDLLSASMIEAKCPCPVVVREELGIPPPADGCPQGLLGIAPAQMVLELELESCPRRAVIFALIEDWADMGGEGHKAKEMLFEEPLAILRSALSKDATSCCQLDRAILEFREFQDVQSRGNWKKIIDLEGKRFGDLGQFGMPSVSWRGEGFDEPAHAIY